MNARTPFPAPQMPADGVSRSTWAIDRAQFQRSSLNLRRTSHKYRALAREYPADAERFTAEAQRLIGDALWHWKRSRSLDAPAIELENAA